MCIFIYIYSYYAQTKRKSSKSANRIELKKWRTLSKAADVVVAVVARASSLLAPALVRFRKSY